MRTKAMILSIFLAAVTPMSVGAAPSFSPLPPGVRQVEGVIGAEAPKPREEPLLLAWRHERHERRREWRREVRKEWRRERRRDAVGAAVGGLVVGGLVGAAAARNQRRYYDDISNYPNVGAGEKVIIIER